MNNLVYALHDVDKTNTSIAGGKGANLGELCKIPGVLVPDGFCVSTDAFSNMMATVPSMNTLLDELSSLPSQDHVQIAELSAAIRNLVEAAPITAALQLAIHQQLEQLGSNRPYAVRSSATAEDLPGVSFAGQQDSYLNIISEKEILVHISKCWASLFTDRAIIYRIQNGFDHRKVQLAVMVQQMINAGAAGVLFTADPLTGNRKISSIDAGYGLGELLVAGMVNPDIYKVSNGSITDKKLSIKKMASYALASGGTEEKEIEDTLQGNQVLTDKQILQLERLGQKIETHFGCPQDIEWCLADDGFYIVQSRPITTLFPVPESTDDKNHVYVSVGHQQMMTDAMKPLGLSFFLLNTRASMRTAGGRLFVDITQQLSSAASRQTVINTLGQSDPLIKDALLTIVSRENYIPLKEEIVEQPAHRVPSSAGFRNQVKNDPAIVADLINKSETALNDLQKQIEGLSGIETLDFISQHIEHTKHFLFDPKSLDTIMAAIDASAWVNEKMNEWLGEKNAADIISQSAPNNITSEMGLALMDVADTIRPYPAIIDYLQQTKDDDFLHALPGFDGGEQVREAFELFLEKYGMRCAGEIDITRDRWREKPQLLIPALLNNIRNHAAGAGNRKFEQGREQANKMEKNLLQRLRQLPDGEQKAVETQSMISMVRNFIGYREYPKYAMVNRFFIYKQALVKLAEQLVLQNIIPGKDSIYFLQFDELRQVVITGQLDHALIRRRKEAYQLYKKLSPPRVITSDGEIITANYKKEQLPAGAIAGLAVSAGIIEGRARVIKEIQDAVLEEGDILVTRFTDPGWTPLFVSIKGLVTEVGGLMTHGAVIAREYGIPAIVGVDNATKIIQDGQRIRINGTDGYVEFV